MKYFRVLFVLALFFGFAAASHADRLDFHATVLDPSPFCTDSGTSCFIYDQTPFNVNFSSTQCGQLGLPHAADDGCFLGVNETGQTIVSLSLVFSNTQNLGALTCDNASNLPGLPATVFTNSSCSQVGSLYSLFFTGGTGLASGSAFTIFEQGAPAEDLGTGSGVLSATPEPDSLILFSTGVMMFGGAYFTRRRGLFAFGKK